MADLNETDPGKIDLTTFQFSRSGCAWCHPGGGPLEYDREGYRMDGTAGLFNTGANPLPKAADHYLFGTQAGPDASSYAGAGFFEVTATTGVLPADQVINPGTVKSVDSGAGVYKKVGKKYNSPAAGGVAEVDCLMCHYANQYAHLERNSALPGATAPKLAASLGLVGAGLEQPGLLNITQKGEPGINPNPSPATWSWNEFIGDPGTPGNPVTVRTTEISASPRSENCALCHFPDKSIAGPRGPANKPLGFTVFQKHMPVGSTADGDMIAGVNNKDGNNEVAWNIAKGRTEGGKRGESLNDPLNPDAHLKLPGAGRIMKCSQCHYALEGSFPALTDDAENVIQPAIDVLKIDHQFAKGDNAPDGKNMDQLDNTATCASCHIDKTHPGSYLATYPQRAHAGLPADHFDKISCKTCHSPYLNGPVDRDLSDFTVGPYRTFERAQTQSAPTGVNRKPVYLWRKTEHGKGHMEIQPFGIMTVAVWANAVDQVGEECGNISPTYQRLGKKTAELLRVFYGDVNTDGVYDWTLNQPQNGDVTLIVNTSAEITDYISQMSTLAGAPPNPVMNFYFNQFAISHNVRPVDVTENRILGSTAGGGCLMCHSSSDTASPYYRAESVGFFDKTYELFKAPVDGGNGLVQTSLPANPPLTGNLERINIKFPYKNPDGTSATVNLSNAAGQAVGNTVHQGEILGYDTARLDTLMNPDTASYAIAATATAGGSISPAGTTRVLGLTDQAYTITPDAGYRVANVVVDGISRGAITAYTFSSVSADHTISAEFVVDAYIITAYASEGGTISPSGTVTVNAGGDQAFTFTPAPGYLLNVVYVDGMSVGTVPSYTFTNVTSDHKIKAYFMAQ